jgi:predicted phosphodiesterase
MKIAVVSDIHSNHLAFQAVMKDINTKDIDMIFFLGDYIFGGYGSNETVDLLMQYEKQNHKNKIISGNIDELIIPIEEGANWIYNINKEIYNELGEERIAFLKPLPKCILIKEDKGA